MYTIHMDYKEKLQEIINASGLSQQSLAEKIGTSLVSLNNWLNGKSTPTRKALLTKIDNLYAKYLSTEENETLKRRIKYYGLHNLFFSVCNSLSLTFLRFALLILRRVLSFITTLSYS